MKLTHLLISSLILGTSVAQAQAETKPVLTKNKVDSADQKLIDQAIGKIYPALVRIHVVMEQPKGGRMQKGGGSGSGTIIHPDGYVLTNHHVAGNGTRVWVRLSNKVKVDATVVGTDPQTDLCILKLNMDQIPKDMKPLPVGHFGDFKTLEVGDSVLAMGSPAGVSQSVTLGVVANLEMITPSSMGALKQAGESVGDVVRWIGHDAVIYFGNSGGPLVNLKGEIIGINEIGLGSLGGAIPADIAKYVTNELIKHGKVSRSWIGLYPQPLLLSSKIKNGVLAGTVIDGSPAAKAGIKAGDVITHIDGVAVTATAREHLPIYNRIVLGSPVGKEITVKYLRDGKTSTTKVKTIERSNAKGKDIALTNWGMTARDLTTRSALTRKRDDTNGVLISSISKTGSAASAKPALTVGDLIVSIAGKKTDNLTNLLKTSKDLLGDKVEHEAVVEFERKGELLATVVKIGHKPNQNNSTAAERAWVGVNTQVLTKDLAKALDLAGKKGVRVTRVHTGSQAEKSGIKKGDILLKMDGTTIQATHQRDARVFDTMIREYPSDESIEFNLMRDGKPLKLKVDLEPAPKGAAEFRKYTNETLEVTFRELSKANASEAELGKGILVESLESAGWASLAGLKGGDIVISANGKPITKLQDLETQLTASEKNKSDYIVLFVKRGKFSRFIEMHPVWSAK